MQPARSKESLRRITSKQFKSFLMLANAMASTSASIRNRARAFGVLSRLWVRFICHWMNLVMPIDAIMVKRCWSAAGDLMTMRVRNRMQVNREQTNWVLFRCARFFEPKQ
jgi:hypothetical protein